LASAAGAVRISEPLAAVWLVRSCKAADASQAAWALIPSRLSADSTERV
jgi:hypothetical protein